METFILLPQPVPATGDAPSALLSRSDQVRQAARARNTQRAYLAHWTRFHSWAQEQGLDLPGGLEAALCDYLVRLAEDGKRMATIRQARAAIIKGAELAGWPKPGGPGLECVVLDPFVGCGGILGPYWCSLFSLFLVGCIRRINMGIWESLLVTGLLARQGQLSIRKRSGNVSAPVLSEGFMPPPVPMVPMDCRSSRRCPCDGHRSSRGVGTLSPFSRAIPSGVRWNVFLILCVSGWSWL